MSTDNECRSNTDQYKNVREGTSQDQRASTALNTDSVPVNEHGPAYGMVFAQNYAAMLNYFDATNMAAGDWQPFFSGDVSAQLALVAIEDINTYKATIKSWFDYLNMREHQHDHDRLKNTFGFLFSTLGSLAVQLDEFQKNLPVEIGLKGTLQNLFKSQLAPAFKRLITYYKAGKALHLVHDITPSPSVRILRSPVIPFASLLASGLSTDWSGELVWSDYVALIPEDESVYGDRPDNPGEKLFLQINHCTTHNLFKSVFDQFLKVFARVISEADRALNDTLTKWDNHEPHYALFLAFLRLFEYVRTEANTLSRRHLDFYYREVLRLREKPAQPGHVHLLVELAKHTVSHELKRGEQFKAGKDDLSRDVFFANDNDFVANQAKVVALKTVYRHGDEKVGTAIPNSIYKGKFLSSSRRIFLRNTYQGRIYASPLVNVTDQSWHPFFNKLYTEGILQNINMPEAETGFAIASHYLLLEEGSRTITVEFTLAAPLSGFSKEHGNDVVCSLTTKKGWLTAEEVTFRAIAAQQLQIQITLDGNAPAITPYSGKVHGYVFDTELPVLVVKLRHRDTSNYIYPLLQDAIIQSIELKIDVKGLKSIAISNDFGPVDASKPFQPFGASPLKGNALIVGSKELFQKEPDAVSADITWQIKPVPYRTKPAIAVEFLGQGTWASSSQSLALYQEEPVIDLSANVDYSLLDLPDFTANEYFSINSRRGFFRLMLTEGFGNAEYQADLIKYLISKAATDKPVGLPVAPTIASLTLEYSASTTLPLNSGSQAAYQNRSGRFFHLAPFGQAEQHPFLRSSKTTTLLPQFSFLRDNTIVQSEAEFYIGLNGLQVPQNLSLLFQVEDGTANPLALKPTHHIDWSYLSNNEWIGFEKNEVQDGTDALLNSGIMTMAVPREATSSNTILPSGLFWIRAAVSEKSDAVCKLQLLEAQALKASFVDHGNSPTFTAVPLPEGTISKLAQPDAEVKAVSQPFASFGGRGIEQTEAFNTRISERLRHKDRAITLWDYERLILEAFPQIYKVKCLNHTCYEPSESGAGIYRELAPGHVTIITIPNLQFHNLRDPLRPYTSLGLLNEIDSFVKKRLGCFAVPHVKNPQFEEVRVSFKLRLYDGFDETFYVNRLQQAITRFLSPWAFAGGGGLSFGGKIYKSVLINFIEEQPYVDYVTDVQLFQDINGEPPSADHLSEVEGSRAVSVLVSAPAIKHEITLITSTPENASGKICQCEA